MSETGLNFLVAIAPEEGSSQDQACFHSERKRQRVIHLYLRPVIMTAASMVQICHRR